MSSVRLAGQPRLAAAGAAVIVISSASSRNCLGIAVSADYDEDKTPGAIDIQRAASWVLVGRVHRYAGELEG